MPRKHRSHSPSSSESESERDDEERKEESGTSDSDSDSDAESSSGGSKSVDSSGSESEDSQERREVQYEQRHSQSLAKRVSGERSREEIKQRDKDGGGSRDGGRSRSSPRRSEPYQRGSQEQGKRRSRSSSQGSFRGNERSYRDRRQSRSASPKSHQADTGGRKPVSDSKSRSSATESKRSVEMRNRPQAQSSSSLLDSPSRKRSDTQSVESGRSNSRSQRSSSASRGLSLRNKNHKEPRSPSDSPRHRKDSPRGQPSSGQNHSRRRSSSRSPRQNKNEAERDRSKSTISSPVSKGSPLKSRVQGVQKGPKSMSASPLVDRHRQEQKSNPKSSSKSPAPAVDSIQDLKWSQKSDLKRRRARSKSSSPEEQDSNSRSNKERKSSSVPKSPRQSSRTSKSSKDKLSRSRSKSREGQTQASVPTESNVKSSKELKKTPTEGKSSRSRSGSQSPHSRSRPQSANKQAKPSGDNSGRISRSQSPKYQERSPKHKTLSSSVQIVRVSKKDREDSHDSDDQSRSRSPVRRGLVDTRHDMRRFESEPESGEITSSDSEEEESTIPAIRSAVQKPRTPELQRGDRNNFSEKETRDGFDSRKRHRFDNEEEEDRGGNRERRMDDRDSYSIRGEERDDYGLRKRPRYGDRERDDRDVARRRDEGSKSLPDDQKGEGERILGKRPAEENKENEVGKPETAEPAEKKAKAKGDILTGRTGGAYIPPAKLRAMQAAITDKSSVEYQRLSWEALKKSINGLVNKVNISNIINIVRELFQENIVRGRGLLARSIIQAQSASPTFTHVYAALVAIINTKFPQIGELILRRLVIQFKRGFKRNDKNICLSATRFIAHLVNQQMAHEVLSLEVLTLLLETPTDDSVEVSIGFLKECGQKLTEVSQRGINAIFERLRNILHEGSIDTRVQYMIEVMFAVRKDGFKDHPAVMEELDLVEESDQFTHLMTLEDANNTEDIINVFKPDPDFLQNEEKYKVLKKEILDEGSDSESEGGSGSGSGDSDSSEEDGSDDEEDGEVKQTIVDNTETNLVILRRTIYLTVQSSLDFEECAHKMMRMDLKPGQEVELCNMILDCCAQLRTYEKFFGLLAQRFCQIDKKYIEPFQTMFAEQYNTIHRLETNKLRNVAKFFGHLLFTDALSWGVLSAVRLNEEDTTSASRIFIKILFQELSEYMGLPKLNERLKDPTLQEYFEGLLPRDDPRKTRFAINFFTTIGLGGLTDDLRDHLKNVSKKLMQQKEEEEEEEEESSSSSSDDDKEDDNDTIESQNSSSSDDSESDSDDSSAGSSSPSEEEQGKKKSTEKVGKPKDRQKERDKYNGVLKEKTESKDKKKKTYSDHDETTQRQDKREWRRKEVENDVDGDGMDQFIRKKSDRNNRDTNSVRAELDSTRVSKRNRNVDKENDRVSDRDSRKKNNRGDIDNRVGGSGSREIEERDSDELRNNSKRRDRDRTTDYVSPWERNKKEDKQNSGSGSRDFRRRSRSLDRQRWDQNSSPKEVRRKERYRRSVSEENVNDVGRDSRRRR